MGQQHREGIVVEEAEVRVPARREQAHAIQRVLDRETREIVGWLYEWNTGQLTIMWKDGRRDDVIYE